jgi:hypothetical protein
MGNRAVITTRENFENNGIGIYVHWNGGVKSVTAFLDYCRMRGFRAPDQDNYGWARLTQVIANFMGVDGLSVGADTVNRLDCNNGDNGTYIIEGWDIVGHEYSEGYTEEYDPIELLFAIDEAQPVKQQLGKKKIRELYVSEDEKKNKEITELRKQVEILKEEIKELKGL